MKRKLLPLFLLVMLGLTPQLKAQNPANGKVVMQAFWWDYWNSNYPNGWYNYLAELAPRLKQLGVDAIWVPPATKGGSIDDNGYTPFDHYDLGDKVQKGNKADPDTTHRLKTRAGDKNEYLRMVAVMHANGVEVIQDVVLNHISNAGSLTGDGGADPAAWDDLKTKKYKNFRYACYETPEKDTTASDYLSRKGRWFKNWQNFHPNPADNDITSDLGRPDFGPDICYEDGAYGKSSNAIYNPDQSSKWMRDNARKWLIWYKKQVGFDGIRVDAIKHFPAYAMEDFIWNLQYNAGFASGGADMYAVGEWVDGNPNAGSSTDTWIQSVMNRAGTFDFALRYGIKDMVDQYGGSYSLKNIKGKLQYNRNKIATFVNSHDTFRPNFTSTGNYASWKADELGGHIEPKNARIDAAYAIAMAVDGSPIIWIEDLFNIGYTGKRWSHKPTSTTDLPAFDDIANLIRCHNKLSFKAGAMKWRWEADDHLVIERSGRAIIGINDHATAWQTNTVATDFPNGTVLIDYGGSSADKVTVNNGQVSIKTPPVSDPNSKRKGYSVWAPESMKSTFDADFAPVAKTTTQQWELSNDLGDSHKSSLRQGGGIPANSTEYRTAGKILVQANTQVTVTLDPKDATQDLTLALTDCIDGNGLPVVVSEVSGKGTLTLNYTPLTTQYLSIRARNTVNTNTAQEGVLITSTYMPPAVVTTANYPSKDCIVTGIAAANEENNNLFIYPNPSNGILNLEVNNREVTDLRVVDIIGKEVHLETLGVYTGQTRKIDLSQLQKGIYFIQVNLNNSLVTKKIVLY